jgi:hypothetical protein
VPTQFHEFPGTDAEVTCDNWRDFEPGDYVWYVPTDAKNVDDIKLGMVAKQDVKVEEGHLYVHVIQDCPSIAVSKGRLSLAEPRPKETQS